MKKQPMIADESGGVVILVALMLVVLLGMTALAIDIGHLMVVRNELRNAADAGALAGASRLYTATTGTGFIINPETNDVAAAAAMANSSDGAPVEAPSDSAIQKGHWCFTCPADPADPTGEKGFFTANDTASTYTMNSFDWLTVDADTSYVNAVRVVASRGSAAAYFAGIFGFSSFSLNAESVAWLGFAGSNFTADAPIAICIEKIVNADGGLDCKTGVMSNTENETTAWTNLTQDPWESSSSSSVNNLLENEGAELSNHILSLGPMSTTNAVAADVLANFYALWPSKTQTWKLTLPMIECNDSPPGPSNKVVGAVNVEIFWMTGNGEDPHFIDVPTEFVVPASFGTETKYECPLTCDTEPCASQATEDGRKLCWQKFLKDFKVVGSDDLETAVKDYKKKSIYFAPSCTIASEGSSGGAPSNVPAKYPRLVK